MQNDAEELIHNSFNVCNADSYVTFHWEDAYYHETVASVTIISRNVDWCTFSGVESPNQCEGISSDKAC